MYFNDTALTRRIPESLILTSTVDLRMEARLCHYPTLLMTLQHFTGNCVLHLQVSLCDIYAVYVTQRACMHG